SRPLIIRSDQIPADRGLVWGESRRGPSLRYFEPAAGAVHCRKLSSVALDLGESSSGGALTPRANPATSGRCQCVVSVNTLFWEDSRYASQAKNAGDAKTVVRAFEYRKIYRAASTFS